MRCEPTEPMRYDKILCDPNGRDATRSHLIRTDAACPLRRRPRSQR